MKKTFQPPKRTKFKKQQKGSLLSVEWKKTAASVVFGIFGIRVLKSFRLSLTQLETTRRLISRHLKKQESLNFRVTPDIPVTKKPNEIRMGKGKGAISFWSCRVKAGQVLVEFNLFSAKKAYQIFEAVAQKLPVPSSLITRPTKIKNKPQCIIV